MTKRRMGKDPFECGCECRRKSEFIQFAPSERGSEELRD